MRHPSWLEMVLVLTLFGASVHFFIFVYCFSCFGRARAECVVQLSSSMPIEDGLLRVKRSRGIFHGVPRSSSELDVYDDAIAAFLAGNVKGKRIQRRQAKNGDEDEEPDEEPDPSCTAEGSLCDTVMKLEDINSLLHSLTSNHKDLMKLKKIGRSFEGRPIYALEIHDGNTKSFSTIVVEFGMHPREWASTASGVNFIKQLAEEKGVLTSAIRWFIVPVLNPDGYAYSTTVDNMWRKNRRPLASSTCVGVDLNRNFGVGWKKQQTSQSCDEDFSGPAPFSEPESKVMRDYVESIGPRHIDAYVAVHTCAQCVLYPYGYTKMKIGEAALAKHLEAAGKMTKAMKKVRNLTYISLQAVELGAAGGGADDFMYDHFKIPLVFTLELGDDSYFQAQNYHHCFHPPSPENMVHLTRECYAALRALAAYLQPHAIPNDVTQVEGEEMTSRAETVRTSEGPSSGESNPEIPAADPEKPVEAESDSHSTEPFMRLISISLLAPLFYVFNT